ncbi:energy-coupled thiamine transporter ThiT [Texcoconibacillus texcoconensis]|uniref:Thiamine transporter n=1 Tax=Texcoconibacillus texcoconensis TaxID=1095777 RepID=A0A840QL85_9BACI|nr:energy-coupled thiamine transporter ThiT [Texcoconibacillus texcoconensis]MBB5172124.1 thiamine transporter [Texcoconibacillus texcoconensis]
MRNTNTLYYVEIAVMATLAVVLSFIKFGGFWAQGGSVSLAMIPLIVIAFRRGIRAGVLAGLLFGLISLILPGAFIVHPIQAMLDYPVAFSVVGLAGLSVFRKGRQKPLRMTYIITGVFVGVSLRFLSHFVAGVVWFAEMAPEGIPVVTYVFLYNISYLIPEFLLSAAVLLLLNRRNSSLFQAS